MPCLGQEPPCRPERDRFTEADAHGARRLGVWLRLRFSLAHGALPRAFARWLWIGGQGRKPICAIGALLHYLKETQQGTIWRTSRQHRVLRAAAMDGARLGHGAQPGAGRASVPRRRRGHAACRARSHRYGDGRASIEIVDAAALLDRALIEARLDAVEELRRDSIARSRILKEASSVHDLERLLSRVTLGTATPRDLAGVCGIRSSHAGSAGARSAGCNRNYGASWQSGWMNTLSDVHGLLAKALVESPPLNLSEGGAIREGYHAELDELRGLSRSGKQTIAQMEARERAATGIQSLKIKYNDVFGYYIEISRAEFGACARPLRTQADAGQRGAIYHPGIEGVREQGAGCRGAASASASSSPFSWNCARR